MHHNELEVVCAGAKTVNLGCISCGRVTQFNIEVHKSRIYLASSLVQWALFLTVTGRCVEAPRIEQGSIDPAYVLQEPTTYTSHCISLQGDAFGVNSRTLVSVRTLFYIISRQMQQ
jgi:hypothetical protein